MIIIEVLLKKKVFYYIVGYGWMVEWFMNCEVSFIVGWDVVVFFKLLIYFSKGMVVFVVYS